MDQRIHSPNEQKSHCVGAFHTSYIIIWRLLSLDFVRRLSPLVYQNVFVARYHLLVGISREKIFSKINSKQKRKNALFYFYQENEFAFSSLTEKYNSISKYYFAPYRLIIWFRSNRFIPPPVSHANTIVSSALRNFICISTRRGTPTARTLNALSPPSLCDASEWERFLMEWIGVNRYAHSVLRHPQWRDETSSQISIFYTPPTYLTVSGRDYYSVIHHIKTKSVISNTFVTRLVLSAILASFSRIADRQRCC